MPLPTPEFLLLLLLWLPLPLPGFAAVRRAAPQVSHVLLSPPFGNLNGHSKQVHVFSVEGPPPPPPLLLPSETPRGPPPRPPFTDRTVPEAFRNPAAPGAAGPAVGAGRFSQTPSRLRPHASHSEEAAALMRVHAEHSQSAAICVPSASAASPLAAGAGRFPQPLLISSRLAYKKKWARGGGGAAGYAQRVD